MLGGRQPTDPRQLAVGVPTCPPPCAHDIAFPVRAMMWRSPEGMAGPGALGLEVGVFVGGGRRMYQCCETKPLSRACVWSADVRSSRAFIWSVDGKGTWRPWAQLRPKAAEATCASTIRMRNVKNNSLKSPSPLRSLRLKASHFKKVRFSRNTRRGAAPCVTWPGISGWRIRIKRVQLSKKQNVTHRGRSGGHVRGLTLFSLPPCLLDNFRN